MATESSVVGNPCLKHHQSSSTTKVMLRTILVIQWCTHLTFSTWLLLHFPCGKREHYIVAFPLTQALLLLPCSMEQLFQLFSFHVLHSNSCDIQVLVFLLWVVLYPYSTALANEASRYISCNYFFKDATAAFEFYFEWCSSFSTANTTSATRYKTCKYSLIAACTAFKFYHDIVHYYSRVHHEQ